MRVSQSNSGDEKLHVFLECRKIIMSLCQEEVSGHLRTIKTKDRVLRCYFWPNCYKEIRKDL